MESKQIWTMIGISLAVALAVTLVSVAVSQQPLLGPKTSSANAYVKAHSCDADGTCEVNNLEVSGDVYIGYELVDYTTPSSTPYADVLCPNNKKVLGGGCDNLRGSHGFNINASLLTSKPYNSEDGWICDYSKATNIRVYAICANIR